MDYGMMPRIPDSDVAASDVEVSRAAEEVRDLLPYLAPGLRNGAYDVILGEDTSGRLPALLIYRVAQVALGAGAPPLVFLQSERGSGVPGPMRDRFERLAPALSGMAGGRALIVTDNLGHGGSVRNTLTLLAEAGIQADVVALSLSYLPEHYTSFPDWPEGTRLFAGRGSPDLLWNRPDLTGYSRDKEHQLRRVAGETRVTAGPHAVLGAERDGAKIAAARQDIAAIAQRLAYTLE